MGGLRMSSLSQKKLWTSLYGKATLQKANLTGRIVVISDIHGNLPFFQGLLHKINFTPEDTLILLGDMIEKGEDNLALLRHIIHLQKNHKVYALCGNCDAYIDLFFRSDAFDESFFQNFLNHPRNQQSILLQMGREAGVTDLKNLPLLRKTIQKTHTDLWKWLQNLPTALETEDYFFIHGGVPDTSNLPERSAWSCMKNDYFYDQDHSFSKYMVVGHCPTTLYHETIPDANPILDKTRKIISIDGGCVLKLDGQLNALLLENGAITWDYFDGLPLVKALDPQSPSLDSLNIRWGHAEVEILEKGQTFTLCRHKETGKTMEILTDFLRQEGDKWICEDSTDYRLPVSIGDELSLSYATNRGILCKKDGITGWYHGNYTPKASL